MKIEITELDIINARTYVPTMEKDDFVQAVYVNCLDKVELGIREGDKTVPMPAMYKDNVARKQRYLMGAFATLYLRKSYEPTGDKFLMAADDYDAWAGSHVFNQLERLKTRGGEVRNRIFDILTDFRDLEKRLNVETYNLVQLQNDPCTRLYTMIVQQSSSEYMKANLEELKKQKGELEAILNKRAAKKHA